MKLQRSRIYQIEKIRDSFSPRVYTILSIYLFFIAQYSCTRVFRHEIRAQSETCLHREYNLAMKNKASGGSQPGPAGRQPTTFTSSPIPPIPHRTTSPFFRNFGGSMPIATPPGVPVAMIVPAFSVIPCDSSAIASSTVVIM